jgi:hypothetical protein
MRRFSPFLCLVLLTACHVTAPVVTAGHASPRPSAATPEPAASAGSAAPVAASGPLKRPAGEVHELAGAVLVEAQYAVAHGAASLIANNGGNSLQLGDASLISDAGGNIISDNGGGILSDSGGSIISDNGGGIIANNGGGLTSKVKWGLLADATPDYGTILPTAGMAVGVQDLTSGKLLTLGQDAAGHPAHVIVTDRSGAFHAYLPASLSGAVRVVGVGGDGKDRRLRTALLTSKLGASVQLDEDTAQAASDCRAVLSAAYARLANRSADEAQTADALLTLLDQATADDIRKGTDKILAAYAAAGVAGWAPDRKLALAERLADIVIAATNLESLPTISTTLIPGMAATEPDPPALETLTNLMKKLRVAVSTFMQRKAAEGTDPEAYFATKPFIQEARDRDHEDYAIRKPSDYDDFLVRAVCANPNLGGVESLLKLSEVLADRDVTLGTPAAAQFMRCQAGLSIGLLRRAYAGPDPVLPKLLEAIANAK